MRLAGASRPRYVGSLRRRVRDPVTEQAEARRAEPSGDGLGKGLDVVRREHRPQTASRWRSPPLSAHLPPARLGVAGVDVLRRWKGEGSRRAAAQPIPSDVAMTVRQRAVLRAELRSALFSCCTGAGGIAGLLWALDRPPPPTPKSCASPHTDALADCMNDSLFAALLPYLIAVGVGAIAGAILAAVLISLLPRRSPRRQPNAVTESTDGRGRWITARYRGTCARCRASVKPGDRIRHSPGHVLCEGCGA
jgi:hypothetical protein